MKHIPDWKGFDLEQHYYVAETAGGDGWEATFPIHESIKKDIQDCVESAATDAEEQSILNTSLEDWIDRLAVYKKHDPLGWWDDTLLVEFNTETWKWERINNDRTNKNHL